MNSPQPIPDPDMNDFDLESLAQDIEDPIWASEPVEPHVGAPFDRHQHGGVRTAHGAIDLMHHVEDEVIDWIERDTQEGPGHKPRHARESARIIETMPISTTRWRGDVFVVTSTDSITIAQFREQRTRVVITNQGPNVVYVGHDDLINPSVAIPGPAIAVNGSREFRTAAQIVCIAASGGTNQSVVDVQDEYEYGRAIQ